jgi:predicted transcriptional regulator
MIRYGASGQPDNPERRHSIRRVVRSPRLSTVGRILRDRRLCAGLKQSDVATTLGWTQSAVADVEGGRRRVDVLEFVDYARALRSDAAELLHEIANSDDG